MAQSFQDLPATNYQLLPSGYVGSQGLRGTDGEGGDPKIATIQITDSSYAVLDDTAVGTAGGHVRLLGNGFQSGCLVLINGTPVTATTFVSGTEVRAQVPAMAAGTYVVYLVNPDGGTAIRINGLTFSATPGWITDSTLSEVGSGRAISIQLSASQSPVYSLQAGSTLPAGLSLTSGGLLSGTVDVENQTTYSFAIVATDSDLQDSPRTFSITVSPIVIPSTVGYLVVAGGGGGGGTFAGGGGAGGLLYGDFSVGAGTYAITIGAGGASDANGANSAFSTVTTVGGGAGANFVFWNSGQNGFAGGSGGGGSGNYSSGFAGGGRTTGQGNVGGSGSSFLSGGSYKSGGGGGAGAPGGDASPSAIGNGGAGLQWPGNGNFYAGGGGGGGINESGSTRPGGLGGIGGGGRGEQSGPGAVAGSSGTSNTGGGGGGGAYSGGSGVVIVRYADIYSAASATTGSPTITVAGGYRTYTFNSSGSITF